MSKASELRNAIAVKLKAAIPEVSVDEVVVPLYERSDVVQPRICVMQQGRTVNATMGPDDRMISIGIGVVGAVSPPDGYALTLESRQAYEIQKADELDGLSEKVIALWSPAGSLFRTDLAGHRFWVVGQSTSIDPTTYRERGVWLSIFVVEYRDNEDDANA